MFGETKRRLMLGLGWADPGDHYNLKETGDLGTVTDPAGSIDGRDYSDLVDAYAFQTSGLWTVVLTDRPDGCSRRTKLCDEEVLILGLAGLGTTPAAGTYTLGTDPISTTNKSYNAHCKEESGGSSASGGTLTITSVTETAIEGSYDVQFGSETVTGSFVATKC